MKGNTKKLYQNVSISKPKKFGNQNTNSINVIVNPNDDDEEEKQMKMMGGREMVTMVRKGQHLRCKICIGQCQTILCVRCDF